MAPAADPEFWKPGREGAGKKAGAGLEKAYILGSSQTDDPSGQLLQFSPLLSYELSY